MLLVKHQVVDVACAGLWLHPSLATDSPGGLVQVWEEPDSQLVFFGSHPSAYLAAFLKTVQ